MSWSGYQPCAGKYVLDADSSYLFVDDKKKMGVETAELISAGVRESETRKKDP